MRPSGKGEEPIYMRFFETIRSNLALGFDWQCMRSILQREIDKLPDGKGCCIDCKDVYQVFGGEGRV
jgi:hypothetical protein